MDSAKNIIQSLYENRKNVEQNMTAYINDTDPFIIKMADGYQDASPEDFEFTIKDILQGGMEFTQKGTVPCDDMKKFINMWSETEQAVQDAIAFEKELAVKRERDEEINYFYERSQIDDSEELTDETMPSDEEQWENYQVGMMNINEEDWQTLYEDEMEETEMEDPEFPRKKEDSDIEKKDFTEQKTNENAEQEQETVEEPQEDPLEGEKEPEEEEEEVERKSKIDRNRLDMRDSENKTIDKIVTQYEEGMDDNEIKLPKGDKVKVENETTENPKFYDDGMPGIIVKINGKRVTRKEFEEFIRDNKEDFIRAYNEVYDQRMKEREERNKADSKQDGKEHKQKDRENKREHKEQKTNHQKQQTNNKGKIPSYRDVSSGNYDAGKEALKDVFGSYSDIPWKQTDVVMDNGDKIHFDRHVKEDQQLHPYRVNISMNGTPMTGSNYGIFARYTNLNEHELTEKIKDSLDKQRIQFKERSQEMDR